MIFMPSPIIGITCDYDIDKQTSQLHRGYYDAIVEAGGLPVLIPNIPDKKALELLESLDGLLLSGGNDVDPVFLVRYHPKPWL